MLDDPLIWRVATNALWRDRSSTYYFPKTFYTLFWSLPGQHQLSSYRSLRRLLWFWFSELGVAISVTSLPGTNLLGG